MDPVALLGLLYRPIAFVGGGHRCGDLLLDGQLLLGGPWHILGIGELSGLGVLIVVINSNSTLAGYVYT